MRNAALAGIEAHNPAYFAAARQMRRNAGHDDRYLLGYLTVTAEGATLTDEGAQRIKEDTAHYITDPDEIAKYRQHTDLIKRLNAFFEDGKAAPVVGWFNLFPTDEKGRFIYPSDGINYAYLVKKAKGEQQEAAPTPEPKQEAAPTPMHSTERKQQNRAKVGRMVTGISKEPDSILHPRGSQRVSPDAPE